MARVLTVLALIIFPLGGWGAYWWSLASELKEEIARDVNYVNERLLHSRSHASLSYDEMVATNFLGFPRIYVKPMTLIVEGHTRHRIEAPWIRVERSDDGELKLALPPQFTAKEKIRRSVNFTFGLSPQPTIWLRTPDAQEKTEAKPQGPLKNLTPKAPRAPSRWPDRVVHQFAIKLPATLELTAAREEDAARTARFTLPSIPVRTWQALPMEPDAQIDFFFSLLAEIAESPLPASPPAETKMP